MPEVDFAELLPWTGMPPPNKTGSKKRFLSNRTPGLRAGQRRKGPTAGPDRREGGQAVGVGGAGKGSASHVPPYQFCSERLRKPVKVELQTGGGPGGGKHLKPTHWQWR